MQIRRSLLVAEGSPWGFLAIFPVGVGCLQLRSNRGVLIGQDWHDEKPLGAQLVILMVILSFELLCRVVQFNALGILYISMNIL